MLPVQKEAARTFCTFLRYNRKQEQRQEMMERLIQGLVLLVLLILFSDAQAAEHFQLTEQQSGWF